MSTTDTVSVAFKAHIDELRRRGEAGDEFAIKSLACMDLLAEGWRYGDADPVDSGPDDDPGGQPIDLAHHRLMRRAA